LIATYVAAGQENKAREEVKELFEIDPQFSAATWADRFFASYRDQKVKDRLLEQFKVVCLD
jgi:hypothetical protein